MKWSTSWRIDSLSFFLICESSLIYFVPWTLLLNLVKNDLDKSSQLVIEPLGRELYLFNATSIKVLTNIHIATSSWLTPLTSQYVLKFSRYSYAVIVNTSLEKRGRSLVSLGNLYLYPWRFKGFELFSHSLGNLASSSVILYSSYEYEYELLISSKSLGDMVFKGLGLLLSTIEVFGLIFDLSLWSLRNHLSNSIGSKFQASISRDPMLHVNLWDELSNLGKIMKTNTSFNNITGRD